MNRLRNLSSAFLLAVVLPTVAGCGASRAHELGQPPTGEPQPVQAVRALKEGTPAVVSGELVEKCPVAGCWFYVKDATGTLRVDSKAAGWVVLDVPLHTRVTVGGRRGRSGEEPALSATGLRY